MRKVDLDHMPDDRSAADLDQGLRYRLRVLTEARAATTTQDRHLGQLAFQGACDIGY
jgi:hypothetical protein